MSHSQRTLRILLVDDEEDMCWALERIVEAQGHKPRVARTAEECLRLVQSETFHLALVDAKLPDMDGIELLTRLRAACPTLPCVLVSGYLYADDDVVQESVRKGLVCGFIAKPFQLEEIHQVLERVAQEVPGTLS
jgi:DNA-binding NtrC family response regulator